MTALNAQIPDTAIAPAHDSKEISKLKFKSGDKFLAELKRRVDAYFEQTGLRRRDVPAMYFKTATIFAWLIATYVALVFFVHAWWLVIPLAALIGLSVAGIGFNVQHDGGHKAYSDHQWINRMMAASMDIVGASSYIWDLKHNSIHHTYTNIAGHDDDIDVGVLGRLSPQQPRFAFHRFQGVYMWLLYGFLAIKWHLFDDFHILAKGRIGGHKLPLPKGKDLAIFIGGKIFFFGVFFVLPMCFHRWYNVLGVYAIAAFVSGVTMSVVFQLAHCVEEASFPVPVEDGNGKSHMETAWAVHQVQTTVDFARQSKFLCWFLGGLNFQVEHHLFHKICHVHYPALSKVVEDVCTEFGIQYNAHKTMLSAVISHGKFLVEMGRPTPAN